ncbi:unnamed protein product, partial [Lymnaea stagnalis]
DNVAIVTIGQNKMDIRGVHSLMWRPNRTRELETIKTVHSCQPTIKKEICQLFPNIKFGLNGRWLLVLAKEWLLHLYKEPVPGSAETKYVGFYMDVVHLLARSLNFTFEVVPKTGEDDRMSWRDFSHQIASSSVDLGATTFPISTSAYYNHTVSFPLLCTNISGVYMNPEGRSSSFPKIKNHVIISVISTCFGKASVGSFILKNLFSDLRGVQIYEYFIDITFRFIGTLVNQNSFQIPYANSARILLWFWNMMVLVMSATLTGTLIANLVGKGETLPFTTFEEMMARGDYQWSC